MARSVVYDTVHNREPLESVVKSRAKWGILLQYIHYHYCAESQGTIHRILKMVRNTSQIQDPNYDPDVHPAKNIKIKII